MIAFLSPATVFWTAFWSSAPTKRVISIPPLPLTSQTLNCFLFGVYAQYCVYVKEPPDTQKSTLFVPNALGFGAGVLWLALYACGTFPEGETGQLWRRSCLVQVGVLAVMGSFAAYAAYGLGNPDIPSTMGMLVGVVMSCYPVPEMVRAITERNGGILGSVAMNAAMLGCCGFWVLHSSVVDFDATVLIANGAGVCAQLGSLGIHAYLYSQRRELGAREGLLDKL